MKHLSSWFLLLCMMLFCTVPAFAFEEANHYESFVYGQSTLGRDLICHRIGQEDAPNSFLWFFAIHGFEDAFDRDGQVLKDVAGLMIDHYRSHPEKLTDYVLYIVPCTNPDGLEEGTSKGGFGRCNANGLDINRDFPTGWKKMTASLYLTGDEPFTTKEAQAIRDLVERIQPTYAADVHGWMDCIYGDRELAKPFMKHVGLPYRKYSGGGMLAQWLDEVTQAGILIELPDKPHRDGYAQNCARWLIAALDELIAQSVQSTDSGN